MRLFNHWTFTLLIFIILAGCEEKISFYQGMKVAVLMRDNHFYWGSVEHIGKKTMIISFPDYTKEEFPMTDIFPVSEPDKINVGSRVLAAAESARMYEGTIVRKIANEVTVHWKDRSPESTLNINKILLLPEDKK
jgi:hypothetical protein